MEPTPSSSADLATSRLCSTPWSRIPSSGGWSTRRGLVSSACRLEATRLSSWSAASPISPSSERIVANSRLTPGSAEDARARRRPASPTGRSSGTRESSRPSSWLRRSAPHSIGLVWPTCAYPSGCIGPKPTKSCVRSVQRRARAVDVAARRSTPSCQVPATTSSWRRARRCSLGRHRRSASIHPASTAGRSTRASMPRSKTSSAGRFSRPSRERPIRTPNHRVGLISIAPGPTVRAMSLTHVRKTWMLVAVLIVLLVTAARTFAADGEMRYGLHVTLAARWLDPAETEAFSTPFMVLYAVHDALVKPMPGGMQTPSLAESWQEARDHLSYTFTLRRNAKFHDGSPVTAEDVKFSFERYKGASATLLKEKVSDVQVLGPSQVRFVLRDPWPDFMLFYGTTASGAGWIVPKKYVEKVGEDGFKKAPIGAGPYRVVSSSPGVELVLEAFDGYWRKAPSIKRLVMRTMTEETTRAAALKRGEVDLAYLFAGPVAEELRRTPGVKLEAPLLTGAFWLELPEQWDPKSPWHDRRVRLAASHAIDRKAINQAETLGFSRLTGSIVPRIFQFAITVEPPAYDPARAKKLLAEAGYPNGFDAGEFYPFPPYNSMGEAIIGYLQAVGIKSRMRVMERAAYFTAWREKKLHGIILVITSVMGNAATRLEPYATKGGIYAYGSLPEIDDLFARQAREVDTKKREALVHQMQKAMTEHVLNVPIYDLAFIWGVGPRVEVSGANAIPGFPYSAPFEDLKLKP
ncbi:MAG: hypothetical protein DMD89_30385 [Candidatus Rokuibacteriota bacterium]|nr:MAG: hypothetical protein DMD89_30385 [Candidatus Rokubacteria bacterium]